MKTFITQSNFIKVFLSTIFWLVIWQALSVIVGKSLLLPSPVYVLKTLFNMVFEYEFWLNVYYSICRVILGFASAVVIGSSIAIAAFFLPFLKTLFYPVISVIKSAPVASFIILALVWIKTGIIPIFISFLIVFPIVFSNVLEGISSTDTKLLDMAKIYRFSNIKKLRMIYMPSVMPYFVAACRTGIGLAWKSGVAAEVICSPKFAMGSRLYDSKVYLETAELFAWTSAVIILSVVIEKLFVFISNYYEA